MTALLIALPIAILPANAVAAETGNGRTTAENLNGQKPSSRAAWLFQLAAQKDDQDDGQGSGDEKPKSLTKKGLVTVVAKETGLSKKDAARAVDAMFAAITDTLTGGGEAKFRNFGSFSTRMRKARAGRNPQTGARIQIPASIAVRFRPSKSLKDAVNRRRDPAKSEAQAVAAATGKTVDVTDDTFDSLVLRAETPVLLEYWAEWSGPSKQIAPVLEEIAAEMKDQLTVAKINIDENQKTPEKYGVRGIPTLMLFSNGELISTKVGATPEDNIVSWIEEYLPN